jgi:hypothetical protein
MPGNFSESSSASGCPFCVEQHLGVWPGLHSFAKNKFDFFFNGLQVVVKTLAFHFSKAPSITHSALASSMK